MHTIISMLNSEKFPVHCPISKGCRLPMSNGPFSSPHSSDPTLKPPLHRPHFHTSPRNPLSKLHSTEPTFKTPLHRTHFQNPTPPNPLSKPHFTDHTFTFLHRTHFQNPTPPNSLSKPHSTEPTFKTPLHRPHFHTCLLYTSPSPRDRTRSRMPSSA